ncbi:MAG TPA: hypothetical protein VFQ61_20165 [Polyangiaceae bacterium]|nr:hypothetical protein [Polyangiaceae bacterium]
MKSGNSGVGCAVVAGLVLSMGCGGTDEPPRTLSPADVTGLPAGDASGTSFTGAYMLTKSSVTECNCRVGPCSKLHGSQGDLFTLRQTGGALNIVLRSRTGEQTYDGGINRDGSFQVGSATVDAPYTSYSLLSGTVSAGVSMAATSYNTFTGKVDGEDFDCDATAALEMSFLNAL